MFEDERSGRDPEATSLIGSTNSAGQNTNQVIAIQMKPKIDKRNLNPKVQYPFRMQFLLNVLELIVMPLIASGRVVRIIIILHHF